MLWRQGVPAARQWQHRLGGTMQPDKPFGRTANSACNRALLDKHDVRATNGEDAPEMQAHSHGSWLKRVVPMPGVSVGVTLIGGPFLVIVARTTCPADPGWKPPT
ncbi:MAG: hypothetical protein EXR01_00050 [Acetobacteraceae bacterium]|nr:hypothetical protein [Acetobacteraceae bacterium]MSP30335.1 hypothetical protein [Acetobacteraceae bacterium]